MTPNPKVSFCTIQYHNIATSGRWNITNMPRLNSACVCYCSFKFITTLGVCFFCKTKLTTENVGTVPKYCLQSSMFRFQLWQDFLVKHASNVTQWNATFLSQEWKHNTQFIFIYYLFLILAKWWNTYCTDNVGQPLLCPIKNKATQI